MAAILTAMLGLSLQLGDATIGRRAVLFGVASHAASISTAATAYGDNDLEQILERAEEGKLIAPPVLARAYNGNMINPKDVNDCTQLKNLLDADSEALYELLPAARSYVKFKQMTEDEMDRSSRAALQDMLSDVGIAEKRIKDQVNSLAKEISKRNCAPSS